MLKDKKDMIYDRKIDIFYGNKSVKMRQVFCQVNSEGRP